MRFFIQIVALFILSALVFSSCSLFSDDNCIYEDYTQKMNLDTVGVWKDVEVVEVISFKSFVFGNPSVERVIQSGKLMVEPIERDRIDKASD